MLTKTVLRALLCVLLCVLAAPPVTGADRGLAGIVADGNWVRERDLDEIGEYHALVIGIDSYQHPNWELRCAENDARAVAQVLRNDYAFKVVELYDHDATLMRLREKLGKLGDVLKEKDSLLVYYAGHGTLERKTGYWIPADAKPGQRWTYLENVVIRNFLRIEQIRARHVLLVSDSCYAGALLRKGEPAEMKLPAHVGDALRTPSRECLTSGGVKPVADGLPGGHSVFARYFLKALKNPPRAAFLPSEILPKLVENVRRNSTQQPVLGRLRDCGDEVGGEFVFSYRRGTGGPAPTFKLRLTSRPTNAQVIVNDRPCGTTPFEEGLEIGKEYRIVVAKPNRGDWERRLVWTKPDPLELVARLRPAGGRDSRLQIALDYIKRGNTTVGEQLLQDVAKSDSADAIRALTELFGMEMKQERAAKAREWAGELRRRFPASAESNEADQQLYDQALSQAPTEKSIVGLRGRIAALRSFCDTNRENAFVTKAQTETKSLREEQMRLYRAGCGAKEKVARSFIELARFDDARDAAKQIETLHSDAERLDGLKFDRAELDRLRSKIDLCERKGKEDRAFSACQREASDAERRHDYASAIQAYERFLKGGRGNRHAPQAQQELARLRRARSQFEEQQYQQALASARSAKTRQDLGAVAKHCEVALRYRPSDAEAQRLLEQVKPFLVITTRPTGAQVLLDGRPIGITDADGLRHSEVERNQSYCVEVRLKGHYAPSQVVRLAKLGRIPLHFELKESALLLHLDDAVVVPTGDTDQYGNPVVTRNGSRTDPVTGWPYEIWLEGGKRTQVVEREEGWLFRRKVRQTVTVDVPRMELVLVPAGEFTMGSPSSERRRNRDETQHRVRLTKPFYLAKYEVTQGLWRAVMGISPWSGQEYVRSESRNPAVYVSWDDCHSFLRELGSGLRLPTESEWEYACRAGSTSAYCFGDSETQLGDYAWHDGNTWDVGQRYTHAVGQKRPNAWGLYDMHGNATEWCSDWHELYPSGSVTDPTGPSRGSIRILRDGDRSAHRKGTGPECDFWHVGLRPARPLP